MKLERKWWGRSWEGLEGLRLTEGGRGGGGHWVVGGRDDRLEPKWGDRAWGEEYSDWLREEERQCEVVIVLKCGDLRSGAPRTILSYRGWQGVSLEQWKGPEGPGRDEGGKGGGGSRGHWVVGGRDDGLEPKGAGRAWGEEYSDWLREEASGRLW